MKNQSGFRKEYSTDDDLFSIQMLLELLRRKKKKAFCMFEYFEKAFDNVWRKELWFKLLFYNINGKMYGIIIIISTAKASHHEFSKFFNCEYDVGQCENMYVFCCPFA